MVCLRHYVSLARVRQNAARHTKFSILQMLHSGVIVKGREIYEEEYSEDMLKKTKWYEKVFKTTGSRHPAGILRLGRIYVFWRSWLSGFPRTASEVYRNREGRYLLGPISTHKENRRSKRTALKNFHCAQRAMPRVAKLVDSRSFSFSRQEAGLLPDLVKNSWRDQ